MEIIHIREPFYSAGRKFKWPHTTVGLGINLRQLDGTGLLYVMVGNSKKVYTIEKEEARDLIYKYKSYYLARTIKLGVIPWECFTVVNTETSSSEKTIEHKPLTLDL